MNILGLDIGGANLKAGDLSVSAFSLPYPMWRKPEGLVEAIRGLIDRFDQADLLAVTMTGELCDCWASKHAGVLAILEAVQRASRGVPIVVWTNEGTFVDLATARESTLAVASANWLALATFAARLVPDEIALLIDIGTTTTDIIPLVQGKPVPLGRTDPGRLRSGELVYRGWKRTPLCALAGPARAGELFATMHDVYLVLDRVPSCREDEDTADGRPATRPMAQSRLARMLLEDPLTLSAAACLEFAEELHGRFLGEIADGIAGVVRSMPGPVSHCVASGSGAFLVREILAMPCLTGLNLTQVPVLDLMARFSPAFAEAACACALARLAEEVQV